MDIFIHDKHISIYKNDDADNVELYSQVIDFSQEKTTLPAKLNAQVVFKCPGLETIKQFIQGLVDQHYPPLKHCVILANDKKACKKAIKSLFYTLKAAGGLVTNQSNQYLLIYRLAKWDLPKGKAEKGETSKITALREVEEECNINVKIEHFICATWHYYPQKGKQILKKTDWYTMQCIDDSHLKPQTIEDIEKVEWMDDEQLPQALNNSYNSIVFVFEQYFNQMK
ncbi:NUDIX hydrolase [Microscilla marina]|uniref:Hydrolase, nudix family protein n=1 Tax=Microscilla marina ATCC 23134 TaxID=313606 RepID=A1ZTS5_MICM2|nr:NUDIX domain-containing protein [Microscilla marina]EAY26177.1 hydrolase, nudix family protein [Microscilla marina ATCC 23134]